jgi:hypothetical protein
MSGEDVPAVVNIKTLKKRLIAHKFATGWLLKERVARQLQSSIRKKGVAGLTCLTRKITG